MGNRRLKAYKILGNIGSVDKVVALLIKVDDLEDQIKANKLLHEGWVKYYKNERKELHKKYKGLRSAQEIMQILKDWQRDKVSKQKVFALMKAFVSSKQSEINLL